MADIGTNGKRFGLVCPKKKVLSAPKASNVFGNEEESSDEDGSDWVKKALRAEGEKNLAKKQTRLNIERALEQDPTICQYDEVFDDMKKLDEEKDRKKKKVTRAKKAKYIDDLLKTAERRKREQEHRIERMVQKEREAEGATFADKESFVTSAYRAKLEEFNKMEREEENMDRLESIGDVTKQPDMSGFYRHLYRRTMAERTPSAERNADAIEILNRDDATASGSSNSVPLEDKFRMKKLKLSPKPRTNEKQQRARQYRRRATESPSESDSEMPESEMERIDVETINQKSSIEDRIVYDDTRGEPSGAEKIINHSTVDEANLNEKSDCAHREISSTEEPEAALTGNENPMVHTEFYEDEAKKVKVSIWEKRTVGAVFVATLERYYARKAMRLGGS